jgi:hypothetical protein
MSHKKSPDGEKPIGSEASTPAAPEPRPANPPPVPPAAKPAEKAAPELRTPAEWAQKYGLTKPRDLRLPQSTDWVHPSHAVADKLYGWSQHAYDFQAPEDAFRISEQDYRAAIRLAPQHPAVAPHWPAVTPAAKAKLATFKPKRNRRAERAAKKENA